MQLLPRYRAMLACLLPLTLGTPAYAADCLIDPGILFSSCAGETTARLEMVGEGGVEQVAGIPGLHRVTVTGAYTSGEKREPEGLFIINGAPFDPYPQGWDGVAVIDAQGRLSLHYAERIDMGDERWNLRDKRSRAAFAKTAEQRGWSAFQSHMLVIDGKIDTRPREGAPRFTRRLLYTLADGTFGLYDTPPMTLHDAAQAIMAALSPVMAFNLDMGSYDYCRRDTGLRSEDCGTLLPSQTGKLSNLLVLSQEPVKNRAAID